MPSRARLLEVSRSSKPIAQRGSRKGRSKPETYVIRNLGNHLVFATSPHPLPPLPVRWREGDRMVPVAAVHHSSPGFRISWTGLASIRMNRKASWSSARRRSPGMTIKRDRSNDTGGVSRTPKSLRSTSSISERVTLYRQTSKPQRETSAPQIRTASATFSGCWKRRLERSVRGIDPDDAGGHAAVGRIGRGGLSTDGEAPTPQKLTDRLGVPGSAGVVGADDHATARGDHPVQ